MSRSMPDEMATEAPLDIVVRFSTSTPDIILPIAHPSSTTALTLKQHVRAQLPTPASESRLRLIHAGKVVQDEVALSKSLHARIAPPPTDEDGKSDRAKGKQPARDTKPPSARVYVHCSMGDALTPAELAEEARAAIDADAALVSAARTALPAATDDQDPATATTTTTTPAPRGFDRLLNTGFTPAEVATLRSQFLAIQAHTHTPDTMPTGPELLALEERWLDNGSSDAGAGATNTGGFGAEDAGGMEDLLWGNLMGFFWPVGAGLWLLREEGVWSRRRQYAVMAGFGMNLVFGLFKLLG